MSDTVELWTLRDENADLRRQLAEAQRQRDELADNHVSPSMMRDLLFRLEAAEDNRRLLATDLAALADHKDVKTILAEAVRLKLEAAQRTAQAADGLAKALQHVRLKIGTEAVGRKADLIDFIDAALAAYQATKEQK